MDRTDRAFVHVHSVAVKELEEIANTMGVEVRELRGPEELFKCIIVKIANIEITFYE